MLQTGDRENCAQLPSEFKFSSTVLHSCLCTINKQPVDTQKAPRSPHTVVEKLLAVHISLWMKSLRGSRTFWTFPHNFSLLLKLLPKLYMDIY